jgi:hypothetical protein
MKEGSKEKREEGRVLLCIAFGVVKKIEFDWLDS